MALNDRGADHDMASAGTDDEKPHFALLSANSGFALVYFASVFGYQDRLEALLDDSSWYLSD